MLKPQTNVDRDLLLDFFLTFARFEYALKDSEFLKPGRGIFFPPQQDLIRLAEPDWGKFKNACCSSFNQSSSEKLDSACRYLIDNPPPTQVVLQDGTLGWQPHAQGTETEAEYLIGLLKTVRNNLVHGGKF